MSRQYLLQKKDKEPSPEGVPQHFRMPIALSRAVDAWIAAQPEPRPTRPEAIRRLLAEALGKTPCTGSIAAEDLNASNDE